MGLATADGWPVAAIPDLSDAILCTVVYADLFDYPLKAKEIHRYLTGYPAALARVEEHLAHDGRLGALLASESPFWFLAGRDHLVALRREREAYSGILWGQAKRYARLVAAVPFVRMVSVTGSLAMNNVSNPQDDIDLLIVTAKNRVWLARGLVILVVHLARRFGLELCPNYVMAEHHLDLGEPSLFTAHELAQLMPLHGLEIYHRLLENNAWMANYLPNAVPHYPGSGGSGTAARHGKRLVEGLLGGRLGDAIERWECKRKIPRLCRDAEREGGTGAAFTPDLCKGHIHDHGAAIRQRFVDRLAAAGVVAPLG